MRNLPVPTQGSVSCQSFLPKETEQVNPEESKRQWSFVLSSFSQVQSTSSVCASVQSSGALWVSPHPHLGTTFSSPGPVLTLPYSAPIEMSIIDHTLLLGAWSYHWGRKWQIISHQRKVSSPSCSWTCEGESFVLYVLL